MSNFDIITVKKQKDFDAIPNDYCGCIDIDSKKTINITPREKSIIALYNNSKAIIKNGAKVCLFNHSSAIVNDNSSVQVYNNSNVILKNNSNAFLYDNASAILFDKSFIKLYDSATAIVYGEVKAELHCNSSAEFHYNSSAILFRNSRALLYDSSYAVLLDNSFGLLFDKATAKCLMNATVKNFKDLDYTKNELLEITEKIGDKIVLYKVVNPDTFCDFYTGTIKYEIGKDVICPDFDPDPSIRCGHGLHLFLNPLETQHSNTGTILKCLVDPEDVVIYPILLDMVRCRKVHPIAVVDISGNEIH